MTSHYDTLEVSPRASRSVIRAAYRCLVQHHHPDKNPDALDAHQRLLRINAAYAVLSDPVKRAAYDRGLTSNGGGGERRGRGAAPDTAPGARKNNPPVSRPFGFRQLEPLTRDRPT